MTTIDAMKKFSVLVSEDNFEGAADFVASLPNDSLTAFTRSLKAQIIELLRKPEKGFIQRALTNAEWLTADDGEIDSLLLELKTGRSPTEDRPKSSSKKDKPKKRRRRKISLGELADEKETKKEPEEVVKAAKDAGADKIELETEETEEAPERDEEGRIEGGEIEKNLDDIKAIEEFLYKDHVKREKDFEKFVRKQTELSDGIHRLYDELLGDRDNFRDGKILHELESLSATSVDLLKGQQALHNILMSLHIRMDKVYDAMLALAVWERQTDMNTFLLAVDTVSKKRASMEDEED